MPEVNFHGVIGIFVIAGMIAVCASKAWNVPWLYVVVACVLYAVSVILLSEKDDTLELQLMWGSHLSLLLLTGGLLIPVEAAWTYVGIFITAIALGFAIPFMVVKRS